MLSFLRAAANRPHWHVSLHCAPPSPCDTLPTVLHTGAHSNKHAFQFHSSSRSCLATSNLWLNASSIKDEDYGDHHFDYTAEPRGRAKGVEWKLRAKGRNFVDFCRIKVSGGQGGDGCVSFHREKFVAFGQPNGGNGGRGGNIVFVASSQETSLQHIPHTAAAPRGVHGKGSLMHGHAGKDLVIRIPLGTIVREIPAPDQPKAGEANNDEGDVVFEEGDAFNKADEEEAAGGQERGPYIKSLQLGELEANDRELSKRWVLYPRLANSYTALPEGKVDYFAEAQAWMAEEDRIVEARRQAMTKKPLLLDINEHTEEGSEFLVARGGGGGYGNPHFLTTQNRSPKYATRGREGQTRWLTLELKTIADAGLVGLPNAGKSTFLQAVSNAHPAIAPYPFTTLNPYIGTVDYSDSYQLKIADIPGLIRGAHRNIGLGHSFLRHVERSKVLVYVIDIAAEFGVRRSLKGVDDWPGPDAEVAQTQAEKANEETMPLNSAVDVEEDEPVITTTTSTTTNADAAVSSDYCQPFEDWKTLLDELEAYQPGLTRKPSMIIANKADVTELAPKNFEVFQRLALEEWVKRRGEGAPTIKIVPVSAKYKKNIVKVTSVLRDIVDQEKARELRVAERRREADRLKEEQEEEARALKNARRTAMKKQRQQHQQQHQPHEDVEQF